MKTFANATAAVASAAKTITTAPPPHLPQLPGRSRGLRRAPPQTTDWVPLLGWSSQRTLWPGRERECKRMCVSVCVCMC